MSDGDTIIELRNVGKEFGAGQIAVTALRGVDLTVRRGEFVAVMGPSGSGKSTLLHLAGGLAVPTEGTVTIGGQILANLDDDALTHLRRRRLGFVFQAFNLMDILTARENVALPLLIDGRSPEAAHEAAEQALDLVGLAQRLSHFPGELSGGERQRVAIARALIMDPAVILADEPTGNLDSGNGAEIMTRLRALADAHRHAVLMVTHDAAHAAFADRVVHLRDGLLHDSAEPE